MKRHLVLVTTACLLVSLIIVGCETTGQSAALGGLLGAAAGGIIGNQSGHALEGALIGAALGGITGAIISNERQKRLATKEEAENVYFQETGKRATEPVVSVKDIEVVPASVKPGEKIAASCTYSVIGPEASPREGYLHIKKDGETVHTVKMNEEIEDGTMAYSSDLALPSDLEDGNYDVVMEVINGPSSDTKSQTISIVA